MTATGKTASTRGVQRRLLVVILACVAVFVATFLYATFTNYPEWMWLFVIAGLVLPPVAVVVSLVLLLQNRLGGKRTAG